MKKLLATFLLSALVWQSKTAMACTAMDATQLQSRLKEQPVDQLVFFASWCSSCKEHLTAEFIPKSLFIAIFDEQPGAEKAFKAFLGETHLSRCIWDKDGSIAAFYAVKALPALKSVKPVR